MRRVARWLYSHKLKNIENIKNMNNFFVKPCTGRRFHTLNAPQQDLCNDILHNIVSSVRRSGQVV